MAQEWGQNFYNQICETIKQAIEEDVINYIYKVMQEMIYASVYYQYEPTQYGRRYEEPGGLADINQFDYRIDMSQMGFTINVFDNAKAVGDNMGEYLDEIIIRGDMYTWTESNIYQKQPFPRDFYQATLEQLLDSGILFSKVKSSLKIRGINVI